MIPFGAIWSGAWLGSRTAGVCFGVMFAVQMLLGPRQLTFADVISVLASAAFWMAAVSIVALLWTYPATMLCAGFARLVLGETHFETVAAYALGGFVVGAALWAMLCAGAPVGAMIFGDVMSTLAIGGSAGLAAGVGFGRTVTARWY